MRLPENQLAGRRITSNSTSSQSMENHTLILGLGNPLMADDGAGIQVVELLMGNELPAGVKVQDGGTAGIGLVPEMEGYQRVFLIDCALMGAKPGEWKRFTLHESNILNENDSPLSLHNAGLPDALCLADALQILPKQVIIYGIQPDRVEWDQAMSEEVRDAIPEMARAILVEIYNS
ncbi:MAG: hydrogenase maturation protease [Anaerolineales bacterium]|nr:hydrogenase maturation protease [Anaerolineales bacterium]